MGDGGVVDRYDEYFTTLEERVIELKNQGRSVDDIAELVMTELAPEFEEWPGDGAERIAAMARTAFSEADSYAMNERFFKLPDGRRIGNTAGIAIDSDGDSIWVYDACGGDTCVGSVVAPILRFDFDGNLVQSMGAGLILRPHGIHIDFEGSIWVTDREGPDGLDSRREGRGHQVFKFSPDGEVLLTLGTAGVAGDGPNEFNQPSAVLVAPNGDIFVGDGHGGESNARIVKYSPDGTFIKTWGRKGAAPGEFETPHGLAMDSGGRLFVADRENDRVQIFDQDGNFLDEWMQFGRPSGIYIDDNDILYVADSQSDDGDNTARPEWNEGIRIGSAIDGDVKVFIDDPDPNGSQEGVVADANGIIYTSLTRDMALRRYVRN
jgi:sugar lactone lactonase YvrE